MSKTDTIARMAWDRRESDRRRDRGLTIYEDYIADAIEFYQLTDRMVTEAYSTKSTDLPKRDI